MLSLLNLVLHIFCSGYYVTSLNCTSLHLGLPLLTLYMLLRLTFYFNYLYKNMNICLHELYAENSQMSCFYPNCETLCDPYN